MFRTRCLGVFYQIERLWAWRAWLVARKEFDEVAPKLLGCVSVFESLQSSFGVRIQDLHARLF